MRVMLERRPLPAGASLEVVRSDSGLRRVFQRLWACVFRRKRGPVSKGGWLSRVPWRLVALAALVLSLLFLAARYWRSDNAAQPIQKSVAAPIAFETGSNGVPVAQVLRSRDEVGGTGSIGGIAGANSQVQTSIVQSSSIGIGQNQPLNGQAQAGGSDESQAGTGRSGDGPSGVSVWLEKARGTVTSSVRSVAGFVRRQVGRVPDKAWVVLMVLVLLLMVRALASSALSYWRARRVTVGRSRHRRNSLSSGSGLVSGGGLSGRRSARTYARRPTASRRTAGTGAPSGHASSNVG